MLAKTCMMVALTTLFLPLIWSKDYCSFTPEHTMCQYKGFGPKCGNKVYNSAVSNAEINDILELHNSLRAKLARGEERRGQPGPQPPAANMRKLEWDDELALVAQRHADQCVFAHDCSDCRQVDRFGVGQNLYIYKQTLQIPDKNWTKAVVDWYDEVKFFSKNHVVPFKFSTKIGHYSQLVWADTYKIGCGATTYKSGRWFSVLYTCNYGPNGNFIAGEMYIKGDACTKCPPNHTCSKQFPGLCELRSSTARPVTFKPTQNFGQITTRRTTTRKSTKPTTRRPTTTRKPTKPPTLAPTRGTTVRTTTLSSPSIGAVSKNNTILYCNFESKSQECSMRSIGVRWEMYKKKFRGKDNSFYGVGLSGNDKTEMFFNNLIEPPKNNIACLDFLYKKISTGKESIPMTVLARPRRGQPGKVNIIRDTQSPNTWGRAQITFRNIDDQFIVMLKAGGPGNVVDWLYLALDEVTITEGECSN